MTKAQSAVVKQLRAIGGAGWLGPGVNRDTGTLPGFAKMAQSIRGFHGKTEYKKWKAQLTRHGITDKGVWCSMITFKKLQQLGIIISIDGAPGCFRLSDTKLNSGNN